MRKILLGLVVFSLCLAAGATDFQLQAKPDGSVWLVGSLAHRSAVLKNPRGGSLETRHSSTAGMAGVESVQEGWSAGAALIYEDGKIRSDYGGAQSRVKSESVGGAIYGSVYDPDGLYLKGALYVGRNSQELKDGSAMVGGAPVSLRGAGKDKSLYLGASLEAGKRLELANEVRLTPHLGVDFSRTPSADIPFSAGGVPALASWEGQTSLEPSLGVALAKDFEIEDWRLTPSLDLSAAVRLGGMKPGNLNTRPGFMAWDGQDWRTLGAGAGRWGGRFAAGIKAVRAEKIELDLKYSFEARESYRDHRIGAVFGLSF
ncbi:MAG: autotransporter outer membrane beta-barrel domain-containing protein [Planctomycetota bacterium]|jgi:outer membrane autotransporter protein|nr:autotransporter outer membrane beta-barrel domain-containing protein [Planctomycetota bacterium]